MQSPLTFGIQGYGQSQVNILNPAACHCQEESSDGVSPISHQHTDCVWVLCLVMQGFVYLKFGSQEGAAAALKALHGRWFAGRQVVAEFQIAGLYNNHFRA